MKLTKLALIILILAAVLIPAFIGFAQAEEDTNTTAQEAKGIRTDLINTAGEQAFPAGSGAQENIPNTVGGIISILLSFVGTLFFIFIIISGIQWMTAGGNEEKVTKARTRIIQASIGLAITVAAYFITWFISNALGAI